MNSVMFFCTITLLAIFLLFKLSKPIKLLYTANMAGIQVGIVDVLGMSLRGVPAQLILNSAILAKKEGINVGLTTLEAHYLAGGNLRQVTFGVVAAKQSNIELTFGEAAAIDLAGRNVLDEVQQALETKIITTPLIEVTSKDGIKVSLTLNFTVKTVLQRVIGGACERTIIARATVFIERMASLTNHAQLLSSEYIINQITEFPIDENTRFEVIAIEVANLY